MAALPGTAPGPTGACSPVPAGWGTGSSMSTVSPTGAIPGPSSTTTTNRAVGGALVGRTFELDGTRLRIELDATFGDLSANSDRLDPEGLDETVEDRHPMADDGPCRRRGFDRPRDGVRHRRSGRTARIDRSVTDIDFGPNMPDRVDPDDSFSDRSTELGWVIGAGVEYPLTGAWTLRLDGSYLELRTQHAPGEPLRQQPLLWERHRAKAGLLRHLEPTRNRARGGHSPIRPLNPDPTRLSTVSPARRSRPSRERSTARAGLDP